MKVKIFFAAFLVVPLLQSCSLFGSKSADKSETESVQTAQPTSQTQQQAVATPGAATSSVGAKQPQAVATAPGRSSSADQDYVVNELTFEVKKLSAELKHLRSQIQDLQANSQMWMNPLAMYDKEIITDNGTSIYGKIIYQDDKIVKVETLIGYLVLEKASIVRVITNVPEEPAQKYVPAELVSDVQKSGYPQVPQAAYVSKSGEPAQLPESSVKTPNCVLVGNINERKDRSGNTIFSGEVKNIGARRADFVKVNFVFRKNWSGDTKTRTAFVEGTYFTFENSGITTNNSLLPGATGKFELIIPKDFGSFIGYSYTIEWEQYK
ncbi:MAG: hypothetical protein Q7J65_09660 [Candidatus Marinimicrobia bacterium]|nr:hypothetical protein [Candidatus Neomarinimicrobiota bacterium]